MDKTVRFEIEGTIIELPLKYDERSQKYLEDYRDIIENPVRTPEGRPILLTIEDACSYVEMIDDEPTSVECSTCRYYRHTPGTLLGVCHNEKMRSGAGNPAATRAHKEETL